MLKSRGVSECPQSETQGPCDSSTYVSRPRKRAMRQGRSRQRRLSVEILETRRLLASLFYWASGEKVELVEQSDQLAVRLVDSYSDEALTQLTAFDGLLADYQIIDSLSEDVWRLGRVSPIGPFIAPPIDTTIFDSLAVDWITESFISTANDNRVVITDELIVGLRDGIKSDEFFESVRDMVGDFQFRPLLGTHDQFVVTLLGRSGKETLEIANVLADDSRVRHSAPNTYQDVKRFFTPNDTLYASQWHLNNTGVQVADAIAGSDVHVVPAWDLATGTGITIAVIDDGIERTHPDLVDNIFINNDEIAGNNIDDDGNGYIDDVSGWSFTANSPNPTVGSNDQHGTSVAGVAAAKGNNNLGVTGAAFNARILPVQIFDGGAFVGDAGAASAIYYAAGRTANGLGTWNAAQVINCSWGGGSASTAITEAFTWASNVGRGGRGVPSFISSGNGYATSVSYPANLSATISGVMAVGSTNQRDLRSEYSNYGTALDFVTSSNDINTPYTVGITTTDRTSTLGYNVDDYTNNTVANGFGGTSSASPLAAGIGALLLSLEPNLTAAQVRSTLRATAIKVGGVTYDANGFNLEYGYGRLDAFAALSSLSMRPISTVPANGAIVSTPPNAVGGYQVNFNHPFDSTSGMIDLSKVTVNGISPVAFTIVDADTLQFDFATNPVTTEGVYEIAIAAGAVKRLSNGELSARYSSSFDFDTVQLQVTSISPTSSSILTLPGPFFIDVNFNEPVAPGTIGVDDLLLNVGLVVSAVALDADTVRYTISEINDETTLNVNLVAGQVTDTNGLINRSIFSASYILDFGTLAFPSTFFQREPAGSMVYDAAASRIIGFVGDIDGYTLPLASGQKISVVVTPLSSGLLPRVELFDASNVSKGFAIAPANGRNAVIQSSTVLVGGTYRMEILGQNGTVGTFSVNVLLNSAFELESQIIGSTNNSAASAQNLNPTLMDVDGLLGQAERAAVSGKTDVYAGGGFTVSKVATTFTDISPTGTRSITAVGDDETDTLSSSALGGFTFPFHGINYNSLSFSTNGLITFGGENAGFTNTNLSGSPIQAAIAVLWDDLEIDDTGTGSDSRAIFWQVVGSGANRQLIIQWNNVRILGGTTYFTMQAVLSLDGKIQFNYAPTAAISLFASATVGVKAAGNSSAQRFLLHFNSATSAWIGPNISTLLSPTQPLPDFYAFSLNADERVSLALSNVTSGNVDLQLVGTNGTTVLATGAGGATNMHKAVHNFAVPTTGTYYARVSGAPPVPYNLIVTKNAVFETENNDTFSTAQSLTGSQGALGSIPSFPNSDWYSVDVGNAGAEIHIETRTPGDGGGRVSNLLNPNIELYSPSNVLILSGIDLIDGRNESLRAIVLVAGNYRIRVNGESNTQGEYYVGVRIMTPTNPLIVNRQVFYNQSTNPAFGNGTGNPINAIDPTKVALLPGETASTIANFTNYTRGLNGIVVDIANATNLSGIGPGSFQFAMWSSFPDETQNFQAINPTVAVTTFPGGGLNGSDRIKLAFPNNTIQDAWLRVTLLADANTGLAANDVFYFGNARFDVAPNSPFPSQQVAVNIFDTNGVRANQGQNSGVISNMFDVDRNGVVNIFDTNAVRAGQGTSSLRSFTAPPSTQNSFASSSIDLLFADTSWLELLPIGDSKNRQRK
jgi:subtilisin family serine protease